MYPSTYYIDKSTGTIADVLLAYGFVEWLHSLLPQGQGIDIRLTDMGSVYMVQLEGAEGLLEEWVSGVQLSPLLGYLATPKTIDDCPPGLQSSTINYEAQKAQRDQYWQAYNDLPVEQRKDAQQILQDQGIAGPNPNLPIWILINTQKAIKSYNALTVAWDAHRAIYPQLSDIILRLFGEFPNDQERAVDEWSTLIKEHEIELSPASTAVQIMNPHLVKGGNQPKAQKLVEKNINSFWLLEYLRYLGLYQAGVPVVVRGSKDRKTYIPMPRNMLYTSTSDILRNYKQAMWSSTAVKSDILAVLRYMRTFLEDWKQGQADEEDADLFWDIAQPGDHASGVAAVFYKDMGSANLMLDMSVLTLPRWMPTPKTLEDADEYLELIQEHEWIISNLREDRSEEYSLLRAYRRFLTTGELPVFLDFCAGLGALYMSLMNKPDRREQDRARLFSMLTIERMIDMSEQTNYRAIFDNEGFQRIAMAIRQATFYPQRDKSKGRQTEFQPEYGLGQKLRQQAPYPDKFLSELGAFIHRYQAETLRKMEHPRFSAKGEPQRTIPSMEDLADITYLVDIYGSEVVCELLVAAGYSWPQRYQEEA